MVPAPIDGPASPGSRPGGDDRSETAGETGAPDLVSRGTGDGPDPRTVVAGLPERTRHLLLAAASAAPEDLPLFLAGLPEATDADWAPAERAGLVRLDGTDPVPLSWSDAGTPAALYDAAPFVDRRRAHRALASTLTTRPDRRAWHLAAAALGPSEEMASQLEHATGAAQRHGGWSATARMLEHAARLSTDDDAAARRYVLAARAAIYAGDATWAGRLSDRAADLTDNLRLTLEACLAKGWAAARGVHHGEAVTTLTTVAVRAARTGALDLAWSALSPAAVAAYYSGHIAHRQQVAAARDVVQRFTQVLGHREPPLGGAELLARIQAAPAPYDTPVPLDPPPGAAVLDPAVLDRHRLDDGPGGEGLLPQAVWLAASLDPVGSVRAVEAALDAAGHPSGLDQVTLNQLGGAAWTIDRTELAVTVLRTFLERQGRAALGAADALALSTLGTALRDAGRWQEAEATYAECLRLTEDTGTEMVVHVCHAELARLAALRGDSRLATELADRALAGLDPDASRSVAVLARWAVGLAALSAGDHERAHHFLRLLVDETGHPVHPQQSLFGMTDVVTAALRSGRFSEARDVAAAFRERAGHGSPRLRSLVEHAAALVAGASRAGGADAEAESRFAAALADPRGATWPYERARVQLDLGSWLRRRRRSADSRPPLIAAHDTFRRLGAEPWERRAAAELRAAGVRGSAADEALAGLTPQQREIVRLAAQGLTNREIADRLFLSPRTVSSHLYRVFPQLGVTSRAQLRDVVGD
ncbi:LuxR family transcriptional regulator [Myceligenerans indicum]|uniref:LuxR family transcriptional regulator n=1 Tax=Myceligenerans indicum TaxID=2593663 RepID=A0ABS1LJH7_9MICO|nr:LuxR family transcriptional regulator [Myceligenerans indicum]MBL0885978.1 LuxR family transcriptional regulator [Myceligenerans indicum]